MSEEIITDVPEPFVPVLALVVGGYDIGTLRWYEVVYHDGDKWHSYHGSKTFDDGESVSRWIRADEAI